MKEMRTWIALTFFSLMGLAACGADRPPMSLFAIADDWGLHAGGIRHFVGEYSLF